MKIAHSLGIALLGAISLCFLTMYVVKPTWEARLLASMLLFSSIAVIVLLWGGNPKSAVIESGSKLSKIASRTVQLRINTIFRILAIAAGFYMLYPTFQMIEDITLLATGGKESFLKIEGTVTSNSYNGLRYWSGQYISIGNDKESNREDYNLKFYRKILEKGSYYRFLIAPHSKLILEVQEINDV